jgi:hypothetical protein
MGLLGTGKRWEFSSRQALTQRGIASSLHPSHFVKSISVAYFPGFASTTFGMAKSPSKPALTLKNPLLVIIPSPPSEININLNHLSKKSRLSMKGNIASLIWAPKRNRYFLKVRKS